MLCNSCINWEHKECKNCYKYEAMTVLRLNPRQWAQIELFGVTEATDGDPATGRMLCKGFADSIVVEINDPPNRAKDNGKK